MEQQHREVQRKSYILMRFIYDLTMAILILGMAIVMFCRDKIDNDRLHDLDPIFANLFGAICVLYGGFRLYRAIKRDY